MLADPRCFSRKCKHLIGVVQFGEEDEALERPACAAFPNGIPREIAYGNNKHLKPFPGDNGIQFERE